jgi:hypothetical protein
MSKSESAEDVLNSILSIGSDPSAATNGRLRAPIPGPNELYELCRILASQPKEEILQQYFENNTGYLTGMFGTNDNTDLAVLFKPKIGNQFVADFCVLQASQGGARAYFLEFELSHERLYTKKLMPAARYQNALGQCRDWQEWISQNAAHYSRELIRMAAELPTLASKTSKSRGVRFTTPEKLRNTWDLFGGSTDPNFAYGIIIGRWSKLNEKEKRRLVLDNRHTYRNLKTFTYEQLARQANQRRELCEW